MADIAAAAGVAVVSVTATEITGTVGILDAVAVGVDGGAAVNDNRRRR